MNDEQPVQPVTSTLPLITGPDGQPHIGCDAVVTLLRSIAEACRNNVRDGDDAHDFASALDIAADALDIRAIAQTN